MPLTSFRVVSALAFGVVATVVSAWIPAAIVRPNEDERKIGITELGDGRFVSVAREDAPGLSRTITLAYVRRGDDFPPARLAEDVAPAWGHARSILAEAPTWTPHSDTDEHRRLDLVAGWPARAFSCGWGPDADGDGLALAGGIALASGGPTGLEARALPVRPLLPGCFVNLMFYALLALVVVGRIPQGPASNQ